LIESIAMNRDFWQKSAKKSAKIGKLDDFIAIERTIMGLINRDLIVDFQAILITWVMMNNKKNRFLHVRNSMLDGRLSDLSLIAIERDFHVDYQRIIDVFATQHKNSRILLK
jgi:hypothetical protein